MLVLVGRMLPVITIRLLVAAARIVIMHIGKFI